MKQLHKKKAREALLSRQAIARAAAVVVLRSYRVGELPDIQIKRRDVIEPLAALAQRDQRIARLVFIELISAVVARVVGNDERVRAAADELRDNTRR
jgi:DNA-dependent protein kinase catalytic subunit